MSSSQEAPEWYRDWFGEEYLALYPHRDEEEARDGVDLLIRACGRPSGLVLDLADILQSPLSWVKSHKPSLLNIATIFAPWIVCESILKCPVFFLVRSAHFKIIISPFIPTIEVFSH